MKLIIEIDLDGGAFAADPGAEVARILRVVAAKADIGTGEMEVLGGHLHGLPIKDANGNRAGKVTVEE